MINPNCYQAFIIQCIIENKKEEAIQYCDELSTAIEFYKWEPKTSQSSYVDSLICESQLEKWQKLSIIHIIANEIAACKSILEEKILEEKKDAERRISEVKNYRDYPKNSMEDLYKLFGFSSLLR
jgi:hypothetical protein